MNVRPDLKLKVNGCTLAIFDPEPETFLEQAHAVANLLVAEIEGGEHRQGSGLNDHLLGTAARAIGTLIELAYLACDYENEKRSALAKAPRS